MIKRADAKTLQGFVQDRTALDAQVFTDDANAYKGIDRPHEAVKHSVGEYVRDMAHTNGLESFWAGLKRGHDGVYHKISPKHLDRYVRRVLMPPQQPPERHHRSDAGHGCRHDWQTAALYRSDCR